MSFFTVCISLEKYLFNSFPHFFIWLFGFLLLLSCRGFKTYILDPNPLSGIWLANIFPMLWGAFLLCLIVSFDAHKFYILMQINLSFFFICCLYIWYHFQENFAKSSVMNPFFYAFSKNCIDLSLTFKSLVQFKLIFLSGLR